MDIQLLCNNDDVNRESFTPLLPYTSTHDFTGHICTCSGWTAYTHLVRRPSVCLERTPFRFSPLYSAFALDESKFSLPNSAIQNCPRTFDFAKALLRCSDYARRNPAWQAKIARDSHCWKGIHALR